MTVENTTIKSRIKNLLRSPSIKLRRSKAGNNKENLSNKVTLEKVLGITSAGNRALACDPHSGLVAYPAGCVVVLLNPKKNKQHHILNSSRKTITTVSFSPDGKYVVTGESGHMPAVRVWDVAERTQVAELHEHKYGVACVAFSPNSKYIVSVGYQHDMIVNVWAWKKNVVVAANKVSSKVTAVSFSDDSSYFVTAGNRHVKFWYLDHTKSSKMNATVPLLGRAGLLGELRNNFFSDVACGKGRKANSTFCITSSGLLCEFNDKRMLDKWVELRKNDSFATSMATSLSVSEDLIFCGCADGTVRAFSPTDLHFIYTLPHPHSLGTDIATVTEASHLFAYKKNVRYPDTVAVSYDPTNRWLSCVYSDHSLYVWDVRDLRKVGKVYSALYHSACVWSVEVYPETRDGESRLSPGSFLSCSSDNTIRLWNTDAQNTTLSRNVISNDLQKVIYMDSNTSSLLDTECTISSNSEKVDPQTSDNRTGIRTICVSPDGLHLASGDRNGTLRIHDLESMEEILDVQAHDSEILCLEYSKPETGLKLLATASRDRLIHVLDADQEYSLLQTLDEHSSSITAVRFAANDGKVRMISCGADKSIYFRTAQKTEEGTAFTRAHHIVRKTTLHDMDVDPTQKYAVIGCQDRSIRIFNICNGKQKKVYKGSQGEDGTVIKVQTDPSGLYVATSCSDKNISIFDFYTGECVANMFGHSEIVTGMKFTNDCKNLISVSGDSCIFVWRLCPELTINMRQRLSDLKQNSKPQKTPPNKQHTLSARNEIHSAPVIGTMSSDSDKDVEEEEGIEEEDEMFPRMSSGSSGGEETGSSEEKRNTLNSHMKKQSKSCEHEGSGPRPRRRWSMRLGSMDLKVKSMLDLRQLESFAKPFFPSKTQDVHKDLPPHRNQELGSTISLQTIAAWVPEENEPGGQTRPLHIRLSPQTPETEVLYPEGCEEDQISLAGSEYQVKKLPHGVRCAKVNSSPEKQSPDSACSMEYSSSHLSSPEHPGEDSEPTEPLSVDGNSSELDMEDLDEEEEDSLRKNEVQTPVPQTPDQEAFLKRHFANLSDLINTDSFSLAASPPGVTPNISDSMSSKFLSQNSPSRTAFPFPSNKSNDIKTTSGAVQPLISEVRPLMENKSPGKQQESHGTERTTGQRLIQKKRTPVMDSRRLISPVAKAAASHNSSAGMRKAQSIHNISSEADMVQTSSRPSKEVHPQPQTPDHPQMQRPRRSLPTVPLTSPTTTLPRDIATPTKSRSRSYMSPTTSSMAKMTRSVSMGDNLNVVELEDTGSSDLHRGSSSNSSNPQSASQSKPTTPVAQVSSPNTSASPFPGPYAAVIPTLSAGSTGNSSSRGLQVKLTGSARPLLHIDIPNPIPDKPLLSSLSPCSKTKLAKKEKEPSSRTPTTPSSNPGAVHLPNSIVQPVTAVCLNTSETPDQIELSMVLVPSQTKNLTEDELHSHTEPRKEDTAEAECPPMSQCSLSVLQSSSGSQDSDTSLSVDSCRLVANELQSSFKRASQLYKMLSNSTDSSEEQQEMARVLAEAFEAMRDELNCLPPCTPSRSPSTCTVRTLANSDAALGDDRTLALLEQYSKLLLSAVEKRMDNKI
ncbi:mitogen-activated protein kinase-binding protein 1-like isoform X4 [Sinocyclocheilus anshuiensis]|uniref:mitogen-activated protein kinase-binding protein 1-like isoform X4 n=1 Tax=Sinocyclocheilus anshuiensis TaxID=1608454 RepID=UPI0007BA6D65|nr:PREDICTED: mitogen-activated protein kinase-binding protein 1-like isoform X4 [Sinocyclocheilus anshuiensis]